MDSDLSDLHTRELPRWLRDLLASPPSAGTGLHQWLYRVACALKPWRTETDCAALLTVATAGSARDLTREIAEAVANAQSNWQPGTKSAAPRLSTPPRRGQWPARDLDAIAKIAAEGARLSDLLEASPVQPDADGPNAEDLADIIFPSNCLLCVARTPADARTAPREDWRGKLADYSLIVPSPMSALAGKRKDGATSHRCLENVGPRRYLIVEFDFKSANAAGAPLPETSLLAGLEREGRTAPDLCAGILLHLAEDALLGLAVHSGGKSVHGWFLAEGIPEPDLARFFRYAVHLGADTATWTRCQLVRLPEGLRDNGQRQRLLFLNPANIPANNPATVTPP